MKEIAVAIQTEDFCPDGCPEISPFKTRDDRLICLNSDRCKVLWKMLREQAAVPPERTEAGA